jgi:hypothetical protein
LNFAMAGFELLERLIPQLRFVSNSVHKRTRGVTRSKAEECRRRAQECLDLARKISLERERAVVLEIAQGWLRLAEQQETKEEQPQAAAQQQQQIQPKEEDKRE